MAGPSSGSDVDIPEITDVIIAKPSVGISAETQPLDNGSDSECDNLEEPDEILFDSRGYSQPESTETHPSCILADVFHEISKVCQTISKKHTHHDAFATAFSNTLLVTDKRDRIKVEAYLKRKNLPNFEKFRLEKPE